MDLQRISGDVGTFLPFYQQTELGQRYLAQGLAQEFLRQAEVQESPQDHIPAYTGEAVEVNNVHRKPLIN
jgi:hypothetical protein